MPDGLKSRVLATGRLQQRYRWLCWRQVEAWDCSALRSRVFQSLALCLLPPSRCRTSLLRDRRMDREAPATPGTNRLHRRDLHVAASPGCGYLPAPARACPCRPCPHRNAAGTSPCLPRCAFRSSLVAAPAHGLLRLMVGFSSCSSSAPAHFGSSCSVAPARFGSSSSSVPAHFSLCLFQ